MRKSKYIKKFNTFLNENSEFSFQQFGLGGVTGQGHTSGVQQANDNPLSTDAADQHFSNIQHQMQRLQDMMGSIFSGELSGIADTTLDLETFKNLKIMRIYPNGSGHLDIYLYFEYDDEPFYMTINNYTSINGSEVISDIFNLPVFNTKNSIRLKGIIMKVLNDWFKPNLGMYRTLTSIHVYDDLGNLIKIPENVEVEVDDVLTEDDKPIIYLKYHDKMYYFSDQDYYYFNYWFEPIKKQIFYI